MRQRSLDPAALPACRQRFGAICDRTFAGLGA